LVVPATPITPGDVAGEPIVPVVPASSGAGHDGDAGGDRGVVGQRDRVVVGVGVGVATKDSLITSTPSTLTA